MKPRNLAKIIGAGSAICLVAGVLLLNVGRSERTPATPLEAPAQGQEVANNAKTPALLPVSTSGTTNSTPSLQDQVRPAEVAGQLADELSGVFRSRFEGAQLLAEQDVGPDQQGKRKRIQLIKADFKFPLVRLEQRWHRDSATGQAVIDGPLVVMAADHVMVQKNPQASDASFRGLIRQAGGEIFRQISGSGLYLVSFDSRDLDAMPRILRTLQQAGEGVARAEPDFIRTLR